MQLKFPLIFILGFYLSVVSYSSNASSLLTQLPEDLPASLYNTLVVASGETFETNDGMLFVFYKDSSIATQFASFWQEENQRSYLKQRSEGGYRGILAFQLAVHEIAGSFCLGSTGQCHYKI